MDKGVTVSEFPKMDEEREASKLNSLDHGGLTAAPSLVQPVLVTCIALCVTMLPEPT